MSSRARFFYGRCRFPDVLLLIKGSRLSFCVVSSTRLYKLDLERPFLGCICFLVQSSYCFFDRLWLLSIVLGQRCEDSLTVFTGLFSLVQVIPLDESRVSFCCEF